MKTQFDVIFDNGGGCTIQHPEYVHHYDDMEQAARDVAMLLNDTDPEDWDGNEPEHRMEYDHDTVASGGYRWFASQDLINSEPCEWGVNCEYFFDALKSFYLEAIRDDTQ